jgi:putative tricarboxylic transport membrane protein
MTGCGLLGANSDTPYPAQDIEYLIPYNPGGGADPAGRQYAESLSEALDVNINVLNQPGADEAIGLTRLATADADGYTLGMGTSGGFLGQPIANPDVQYDGLGDFEPITQMTSTPYGLFVASDSEYETLDDLLNAARQNPGDITISAPVRMGSPALAIYYLEDQADVEVTLVTTSGGSGEAALEVMGGRIDAMVGNASGQVGLVESGDLRALGYSGTEDYSDHLPDTESFNEQGYDIPFVSDYMTMAPAGIPDETLQTLLESSAEIVESKDWQDWAHNQGAIPVGTSGDELRTYLEETSRHVERGLELAQDRFDE